MQNPDVPSHVTPGMATFVLPFYLCSQELVEQTPGSNLVGTDEFGNEYFERLDTQVGEFCVHVVPS